MGELWDVFGDNLGENWVCYNNIALYSENCNAQYDIYCDNDQFKV